MLKWLLPEYEVYKIYQKYPGNLYEYPALRFSQWLTEKKNISFLLYLHTKGATHKSFHDHSKIIRKLWSKEFTKPRNLLYISEIINNKTDIATPLHKGNVTWYNGMFISKRAFNLNNVFYSKKRAIYEYYFINKNTRIRGIIDDKCQRPYHYIISLNHTLVKPEEYKKTIEILKFHKIKDLKQNFSFLIFSLILIFICKFYKQFYNRN